LPSLTQHKHDLCAQKLLADTLVTDVFPSFMPVRHLSLMPADTLSTDACSPCTNI